MINPATISAAEATLAAPHRIPQFVRPVLRGERVARFWLPRELCPPRNRLAEEHWASREKRRDTLLAIMRAQFLRQGLNTLRLPLDGYPQILEVRFSSQPVDSDSGFAKQAVDCLAPSRKRGNKLIQGLGLIADDGPMAVQRCAHWEYAPPRMGVVLVEVRR